MYFTLVQWARQLKLGSKVYQPLGFQFLIITGMQNLIFEKFILSITINVIKNKLPSHIVLNVNFPKSKVNGVKVCRQANTHWEEKFCKRENQWERSTIG